MSNLENLEAPCSADFERPQPDLLPQNFKRLIGRIGLVVALALGVEAAIEVTGTPPPAQATTVFSNDYPDSDARLRDISTYDWWKDEDGNGVYSGPEESNSSRGFGYRNCTDGVAYWVKKYTGVTIPWSWGNANTWDNNATGYSVYDGSNVNNIEPGDIAQSDDGTYGHVGFVTAVTKDSSGNVTAIDTAELNKAGDGNYTANTYSTKDSAGKFSRGGSNAWDHFIDVNGLGNGLNNEPLATDPSTPHAGFTGDWNGDGYDTVAGAKNDSGSIQWYLSDSLSSANANNIFHFGSNGDMQVAGDWNGDGYTSVGVVRNISGVLHWYLTNYNQDNAPVNYSFDYGGAGDIPVVGDWNNSGHTEIGVVTPTSAGLLWKLKENLAGGSPDMIFYYGAQNDAPVTGDWNGDGITTAGVARSDGTNLQWYLTDVNDGSNADNIFYFGASGDIPVTGDWNHDGYTSVGLVRKDATGPRWYLTDYNQANAPVNYGPFYYGSNDMTP